MKQYVFYDLDGTIVDTRKDIAMAAQHMVSELFRRSITDKEVYRFVGKGIHYLLEGCLQSKDPKVLERGGRIYRDYYAKHMLDNTKVYPEAEKLFGHFVKSKQAVVTNKPDPFTTDILKALGIASHFVAIVSGNSDFPKKPDPKSVKALLAREGVDARDALFVGDSLIDFETGKNAGVETVLVSHGFSPYEDLRVLNPDFLVRNFNELYQLIQQKGW